VLTVEVATAAGGGDAAKQATAINAVDASIVVNREVGVFLKSVLFRCSKTLALQTHGAPYGFTTSPLFVKSAGHDMKGDVRRRPRIKDSICQSATKFG
jgi:hypothetical protein